MSESKTASRKIPRVLYASDDDEMSDVEPETIPVPEAVPESVPTTECLDEPVAVIKKKGRPKKAPEEKAPRKKREHSPIVCKYCGKNYTQGYSLDKHINDNRCYVKREQDKAEIERLKSLPPPPPAQPIDAVEKKPRKQAAPKEKVVREKKRENIRPASPLPVASPVASKPKYMFKFC